MHFEKVQVFSQKFQIVFDHSFFALVDGQCYRAAALVGFTSPKKLKRIQSTKLESSEKIWEKNSNAVTLTVPKKLVKQFFEISRRKKFS